MATTSTCVKCGHPYFEITLEKPFGADYNMYFVRCADCGGVVSVIEELDLSTLIHKQNSAIKAIAAALNVEIDL
jgi:hypothetical protein